MRILAPLFAIVLIASVSSAQSLDHIVPGNFTVSGEGVATEVTQHTVQTSYTVDAAAPGIPTVLAMDTLTDHYDRASQYAVYTYAVNNNPFPVVGSNTLYVMIGQKFPFSGSATVHGFLFACSQYRVTEPADTLGVNLWAGSATTGLPTGNSLTFGRFVMSEVDSNRTTPVFTYVPMNTPSVVNGPFVGTVQTRRLSDNDDLFVIFSSAQGDGRQENRACIIAPQNNQLVALNLSQLPLTLGGQPLDVDVMILPVIETGTTGIDAAPATITGIELRGIAPQPAAEQAVVHLRNVREMHLTIDILDLSGRVVSHAVARDLFAGTHAISVPVSGLASGTYFLRFVHGGGAFAMPLRVAR